MSDIQQFLALMADALHNGALGEEGCADLCKALNGVPAEYHAAAFKAFLGGEDDAQDAPEDYAVVKTYESPISGIGDEIITSSGTNAVVISIGNTYMSVLHADQTVEMLPVSAGIRTGRNFPAIAAILDKIRK